MTDQLTTAEELALKVRIANEPHIQRAADELSVLKFACEIAIAAGYSVSLQDGEDWTVQRSQDVDVLVAAAQTTDEDRLRFRKVNEVGTPIGTIWFVYGNSASEVIADHSVNPEMDALMELVNKFTDKLEAEGK